MQSSWRLHQRTPEQKEPYSGCRAQSINGIPGSHSGDRCAVHSPRHNPILRTMAQGRQAQNCRSRNLQVHASKHDTDRHPETCLGYFSEAASQDTQEYVPRPGSPPVLGTLEAKVAIINVELMKRRLKTWLQTTNSLNNKILM